MPIYEYECRACAHVFDALQKISDEPLVKCPECGKAELRKVLSAPRFRLKGKGWYETDFKTGNKRNLHDGNKEKDKKTESKDADSKSDKKSDSKSGGKSEGKSGKSSGSGKSAQA